MDSSYICLEFLNGSCTNVACPLTHLDLASVKSGSKKGKKTKKINENGSKMKSETSVRIIKNEDFKPKISEKVAEVPSYEVINSEK
jgi:hypothetical protein